MVTIVKNARKLSKIIKQLVFIPVKKDHIAISKFRESERARESPIERAREIQREPEKTKVATAVSMKLKATQRNNYKGPLYWGPNTTQPNKGGSFREKLWGKIPNGRLSWGMDGPKFQPM